jgi:hypothetical protein
LYQTKPVLIVNKTTVHELELQISIIGPTNAPFTFSLFRLKASTCFEHFFAHHLQEVLYVQQLVFFMLG